MITQSFGEYALDPFNCGLELAFYLTRIAAVDIL